MGDTRRTWPTELTEQGSYGLPETETANMGPSWLCTRSYVYILWLLTWCSCENPNSGSQWISFAYSWDSFLLLENLVQPQYQRFCIVLLYLVLSCLAVVSWSLALLWCGDSSSRLSEKGREVGGTWKEGNVCYDEWDCMWMGCIVWENHLFQIKCAEVRIFSRKKKDPVFHQYQPQKSWLVYSHFFARTSLCLWAGRRQIEVCVHLAHNCIFQASLNKEWKPHYISPQS